MIKIRSEYTFLKRIAASVIPHCAIISKSGCGILLLTIFSVFNVTPVFGQCLPDRHSTDGFDGWISCNLSANPNSNNGNTHWIKYDFGQSISMHDMHIWNMNHPNYLDDGVKDILIEYSTDNSTWITVDTFTCPRASASGFYRGFRGPDLKGINARYLLITPITNYGGGCYAMSELKINTGPKSETEFTLDLVTCENDGVYQNLSGDLSLGGTYIGKGVADNGDGTFDFDAIQAGAGTHLVEYNYSGGTLNAVINVLPCSEGFCRECDDCANYDQAAVDANPIAEGVYYGHKLNASGNVLGNSNITFWGGNSVELKPNFEVQSSGSFDAAIRTCYENLLMNSGFENDDVSWRFLVSGTAQATIDFVSNNPYEEVKDAELNVTTPGGSYGNVLLRYENLSIESGGIYRLSFAAKGNGPGLMEFMVEGESNPRTKYVDVDIELGENWNVYAFEFVADSDRTEDVRIQFRCGKFAADYFIDRVSWARVD